MPLGVKQSNSFLYISLDVWQDRVFYNEKDYPAGYFAASILNFQRDDLPRLAECGGTFGNLFPGVITAGDDSEAKELLPEVWTKLSELAELLWKYPPFSLNDMDGERHLHQVMLSEKSLKDLRNPLSPVFDFYPRYCNALAVAPLAIYHFCIAGWFFELDYLRRLGKRDETHFAVAAHDCFNSERFWKELHELGRMDIEPFSVEPRMESAYVFARNPRNEKKLVFVNRLRFDSLLDFYVFDLLNGLHHGHAPSQCRNCGKYFLTTTGHTPKYCNGIAPQDPRLTCRQYGAKHGDKESNRNHPIYTLFSTRASTIRKHAERGKIDKALKDEALKVATELREKAFMDSEYAADGYKRDMELDVIYAKAKERLGIATP